MSYISRKTITHYFSIRFQNRAHGISYLHRLFCLFLLMIFPFPGSSNDHTEDNKIFSISASYTVVNEYGEETSCKISSNNSLETLNNLRNTDCKLSLSSDPNDQSVILISHSPYHETKLMLLTARNLLMWAYLAVHAYKVWDSGSKILWPSVCPCSGQPNVATNTQKFFFTYYISSMLHHGWSYFGPYLFWPEQKTNKKTNEMNNSHSHPSKGEEEGWIETLTNTISTFTGHPYTSHILSFAFDSAALKWDCQCAGYFTDGKGSLYFNGHLWMLLLNVAIFTADLAIDYL